MAELEAEFGVSLTEKGYLQLKSSIDWQSKSERSDYYFDLFDSKGFLLSKNSQWKWRIKDSKQGTKGEISHLKSQTDIEFNELKIRFSKRSSSSAGTKKKSLANLLESTIELIDYLATSNRNIDLEVAREESESFNDELERLSFYPEIVLQYLHKSDKAFALPAYWNEKKRRGLLIEFELTNLEVFIEKKSLLDAKGREIFSYALEAEPESVLEPKELRRTGIELIEFLQGVGLESKHLNTVNPDPWAFVKSTLNRFPGLLKV